MFLIPHSNSFLPIGSPPWDTSSLLLNTKATVTLPFGTQMLRTTRCGSATETDLFQMIQQRFLPLTTWES